MRDMKEMGAELAKSLRGMVERALEPILQRVAAIEAIPPPKDGESVPVEQVERMVAEAVGKAMGAVRMPADGEPGRDAVHIEILPAIDGEKAYPRGTYARHAGGLWRSFETTAGMKGWECIVEGVAEISVTLQGRSLFLGVTKSAGTTERHPLTLPVMVYRGVWKEGEYQTGDTVTWNGSLWHCDVATDQKPGDGAAWTMAAKGGAQGASAYTLALRSGFKGTEGDWLASLKGPKGEPGPGGRDLTQLGFDGSKH
jgi:hypothetical protein